MTKTTNPTAVAMHASAETVLRFERGFHNFPAVKALIPEARCCAPWYSFDGDRHLEVAIPNEAAYQMGFDGRSGRFSVLLPA